MMFEFTSVLILLIFTLPIGLGLTILFFKASYTKQIFLLTIIYVVLGVLTLGFLGEQEIVSALSFMGEPITFSVSATPLLLFSGNLLALFFLVWRSFKAGNLPPSRYHYVLLSFSLSFGFVAFVSGQFMIRYIALDMVGLLAALTVLSSFTDLLPLKHFIIVFQILRLGDLSLLVSILLINHYADTLDISQMITAAINMPVTTRTWVFLGFFLALLIKVAIWPFGFWLRYVKDSDAGASFWISGLLMPSLGYYLLYRILPIISSDLIFQRLSLFTGLFLFFLTLLVSLLRLIKFDRFTQLSGIYGCFLLGAVAFGTSNALDFYLLALVFHRLAIYLQDEYASIKMKSLLALIPILIHGLFIWINFSHFPIIFSMGWVLLTGLTVLWDLWTIRQEKREEGVPEIITQTQSAQDVVLGGLLDRPARVLSQKIEHGLFLNGISHVGGFLRIIANWVNRNIEQRLDNALILTAKKLMAISAKTFYAVEVDAVQQTGNMMDQALKTLEEFEQNVLKKSLKWDLVWIPVFLVFILIFLFSF
jgi:hypothetical protein